MSNQSRSSSWFERKPITRREALEGAAVLGAGAVFASCGGGGDDGPSLGRGGRLRVGVAGGGAEDTLDAHHTLSDPDIARIHQLYEPLAAPNLDFKLEMVLAESIEPNAAGDVWTIRLKDGITFHNGRPVTADDVAFSLRRVIDPKFPGLGASGLADLDPARMKKLDARTLRVPLKRPYAVFADEVGQYYNGIVPENYDPKKPVGTGPFKFRSFRPGEQSVFVRNENYWRDGEPRVEEVVIIDFPDDTGRVNALLGGQVDAITNLPAAQLRPLKSNSEFKALISETGGWLPFTMRVDRAPFDDVRVRQAMRLLVDRPQMIQQALDGQGRVANDLYSPFDPCFAGDIPQRERDLDQARSLLRAAGQSNLEVELVTAPVNAGIVEAAQVLAQQAKDAGVTVNVRKVDSGTFYSDNYLQWTFAQDFWFTRNYLPQVGQSSLPDALYNETHWADGEFRKLIAEARATIDEPKRCEILREAQQIEHERGGYIIWSYNNLVDAHSARLGGLKPSKAGIPLGAYGFRSVGFTA